MPDPVITIAIKVNATERASQVIPTRKAKVLLADVLPAGGTVTEQAEALLAWIVSQAKDGLSADNPRIGNRQYDVMLAAVREVDDTWDQDRVQYEGMDALIVAYDALS